MILDYSAVEGGTAFPEKGAVFQQSSTWGNDVEEVSWLTRVNLCFV
jgi:hypothetical protein